MANPITGHMVVKNEDRYVWYAIQSVLPYVSKLLIFDTGSTDKTIEIIKSIHDPKINFRQKKVTFPADLVQLRSEQIGLTKTDWIWLVDGDEIYPKKLAGEIVNKINEHPEKYGLILHRYDLLGDIYHAQDESVGTYDQFGKKGHYVLRLINKSVLPGLSVKGEYPNEYYISSNGRSIKIAGKEKYVFLEDRLWHAMYLRRSTLGGNLGNTLHRQKTKIELGQKIAASTIPEVFYIDKPDIVDDVTQSRGIDYEVLAAFITPLKKIKRLIQSGKTK